MRPLLVLAMVSALSGCSLKQYALNNVSDALASGGSVFAADDDPELVRAAAPFSLKLTESLVAENPRHQRLLVAAARGFTQYAYAFLQQEAEEIEEQDLARSTALHEGRENRRRQRAPRPAARTGPRARDRARSRSPDRTRAGAGR